MCREHKQSSNTHITRHNFSLLFKKAFDNACKVTTITNGFKICGLFPLNPDAVDYTKCISTRRKEIFGLENKATNQDYVSCLKVLEEFLEKDKINEYENRLNDCEQEDMYLFWRLCKQKAGQEQAPITDESNRDTYLPNLYKDPLNESFINDAPLEINGIVYTPVPISPLNNTYGTIEEDVLLQNICTDVIGLNPNRASIEPDLDAVNKKLKVNNDVNTQNCDSTNVCREFLDDVLNKVFDTIDNVRTVPEEAFDKTDTKCDTKCKVNIISNIVIGNAQETVLNNLWNEHLYWPQQENKPKTKVNSRVIMPFAITSDKWAQYHKEQEIKKNLKCEEVKKRKVEREEKKNQKEKSGNIKNAKNSRKRKMENISKNESTTLQTKKRRETKQLSEINKCETTTLGEQGIIVEEAKKVSGQLNQGLKIATMAILIGNLRSRSRLQPQYLLSMTMWRLDMETKYTLEK